MSQNINLYHERELEEVTFRSERSNPQLLEENQLKQRYRTLKRLTTIVFLLAIAMFFLYLFIKNQETLTKLVKQKHRSDIVSIDVHNTADHPLGQVHEPTKAHKDIPFVLLYPTVGVPQPGTYYNSTPIKKQDLAFYDQTFLQIFKPYNNTDCDYAVFGDSSQDSFVICKNFLKFSDALLNFGISGNDKFGCDISSTYPLTNYQFDCLTQKRPACTTNDGNNEFTSACLSDNSERGMRKYTLYTLYDALKSRGLIRKRVTLKLDIKGVEYQAWRHFPLEYLQYIDQIIVKWELDEQPYPEWGHLDIFKGLATQFIPVNLHQDNTQCFDAKAKSFRKVRSRSNDVTLVNKKWIRVFSNSRSLKEHFLNAPNPLYPKCE